MGRTVKTFTDLIRTEVASWAPFRRALRKEDQKAFDEMFRAAKLHLAENFYAMRDIPFESIIVSIALEQQKKIQLLQDELKQFRNNGKT